MDQSLGRLRLAHVFFYADIVIGGVANDNAGKVDGGKSQAEQRVDEYANG